MEKEIYCRKLGHHVPLSYCLSPGQKTFCSSFRNCWFSMIDVDAFLKERYSTEEISAAENHSAAKITSIMSVIERFRVSDGEKKE